MRNIDGLIEKIYSAVKSHKLAPGQYARWLWNNEKGNRNLGSSEYGCADAANILYTIGRLATDADEKSAAISALQAFQHKDTGLFEEPTHHPLHTTAHCTAALWLFGEKPLYPFYALEKYMTREGLYTLLDSLDWVKNPWSQSHIGAGIYAAMVNTGSASLEWQNRYFDWLWNEADPKTGMWRKGCIDTPDSAPLYHSVAGTFHYIFNHEYAKRPLKYPDKLIDTMIYLYTNNLIDTSINKFGKRAGFLEIDWVYTLNRAMRQTTHRYDDGKLCLREFASNYIDWLEQLDTKTDDYFNDLHMLFGTVCCIAELQTALPGEIATTYPLHLVLDVRPFI